MNKFLKVSYILMLGIMALIVSSCTNEFKYEPASPTEQGGNVYMTAENTAYTFVPDDEQNITVTIHRVDATMAESVKLLCDNELFTLPTSVEFAAGEKDKDVTVIGNVPTGGNVTATISLENAFLYANSPSVSVTVNVYRMFTGMIAQPTLYEDQWKCKIYELAVGEYMIPDAFADGYDYKFNIDFETNEVNAPTQFVDYYNDEYGRIGLAPISAKYDPENLMVSILAKFTLPDIGAGFNGQHPVYIVFDEDPQQ